MVDLACVTPPFDSIKFGASVVAPTAKNSGTKFRGSFAVEWQILAPNFTLSRAVGRAQSARWLGLARSAGNLRLEARNKRARAFSLLPTLCFRMHSAKLLCKPIRFRQKHHKPRCMAKSFARSDQILIYGENNFAI